MIVYNKGTKREIEAGLRGDGWKIKRIVVATAADVAEISPYPKVIRHVKEQAARRRKADAETRRRADAAARQRVDQLNAIEAAHRRNLEEMRDYAVSKATGDLFAYELESDLLGNNKIASICAKASLFFGHASLNKKDLFTAISIDFADFQSQFNCPKANKLLAILLNEMNEFLRIDEQNRSFPAASEHRTDFRRE